MTLRSTDYPLRPSGHGAPLPAAGMRARGNTNHHLWRNGRLWWIALTVHLSDSTARRVRRSLRTADVEEARRRRDAILARIEASPDLELPARGARHVALAEERAR